MSIKVKKLVLKVPSFYNSEAMKKWIELFRSFYNRYCIFSLILLFSFFYSTISIIKYIHFQTGLDLAIYVQTFWNYTHFHLPYVTLHPTYGDIVFADHFTPSLFLLTPLYALLPDPKTLLVFQSLFFCIGAYPIFKFAKKTLKSTTLSLALSFVFLVSFSAQNPLTFDFHPNVFAASFLPWIFWTLFERRWKTFLVLCFLSIGGNEDMSLYLAGTGLYLVLSRLNRKIGIFVLCASVLYFLFITQVVMPALVHNTVKDYSNLKYSINPFEIFLGSSQKIVTTFAILENYLFTALFSGWFFLLTILHLFINFASKTDVGRENLLLHYRTYIDSISAFSSILGILFLQKRFKIFKNKKILCDLGAIFILNAVLLDLLLHLPLNSFSKSAFYFQEPWITDNNTIINKIPKDASLLTLNSLAPQTAYRQTVYYFPQHKDKVDYIVADTRPNQPAINTWASAESPTEYIRLVNEVISKKEFKIIDRSGNTILLKRIISP